MKKFSVIVRTIYSVTFLFAIYFFIKSPSQIAIHLMDFNKPNEFAPKIAIFLNPLICFVIGEFQLYIAKKGRQKNETINLPFLLPNEWQYLCELLFISILLVGMMIVQIKY